MRDSGGHAVALKWSMENVYGVRAGEGLWAGSDIGWVVGHSYIVYGPLLKGCTTILYEGNPVGTPDPGAFWRVASQHGVAKCAVVGVHDELKGGIPVGFVVTKAGVTRSQDEIVAELTQKVRDTIGAGRRPSEVPSLADQAGLLPIIRPMRLLRGFLVDQSSKRLYATGVPTSVRTSASVCPPMMTLAIARFVPEPTPEETTRGSMPATKARVVMRIGRSRSRFARRIASLRSTPWFRSEIMLSICRMPFFFTMPNRTRMPSEEKMLIDWFRTTIDRTNAVRNAEAAFPFPVSRVSRVRRGAGPPARDRPRHRPRRSPRRNRA